MSLGIVFKGPEGIVLAADSRVTLNAEIKNIEGRLLLPATFDNATKLLRVTGQDYVGAVTYGVGAIGMTEPRTAHSFLPEFENQLANDGDGRLTVETFANKFSDFFQQQWAANMPEGYSGPDMTFLIGGFDVDSPYGKVYKIEIPSNPIPEEQNQGQFGIVWGGQLQFTNRLLQGFDPRLPMILQQSLGLDETKSAQLQDQLGTLALPIPYQFLPLQDCVDLSIFLIRTTMELQTWLVDVRGVGGAIDVATITRTKGFEPIQQKVIVGQRKAE
jgi:hypothetical protein